MPDDLAEVASTGELEVTVLPVEVAGAVVATEAVAVLVLVAVVFWVLTEVDSTGELEVVSTTTGTELDDTTGTGMETLLVAVDVVTASAGVVDGVAASAGVVEMMGIKEEEVTVERAGQLVMSAAQDVTVTNWVL